MSRIGKKIIPVPEKTTVLVGGSTVSVRGPLGELKKTVKPIISVAVTTEGVKLNPQKETIAARALWGTYASHIKNMIAGVNKAYEKKLIIEGVGYKADIKGKNLVLNLGFSHQVFVPIPEDVKVAVEKNTITVTSINKESLGQFGAFVRSLKKPEPYKGKGIRYADEVVRRKQGKKAA